MSEVEESKVRNCHIAQRKKDDEMLMKLMKQRVEIDRLIAKTKSARGNVSQ